jgi:hypothetical protein
MIKGTRLFVTALAALLFSVSAFSQDQQSEPKDESSLPLIERSVTQGFFGVRGSYFDQEGNHLEGQTLVDFLQSNKDGDNAKRVQDAMGQVAGGKLLYWAGLIVICISPLTVDYSSITKTGKEPSYTPFIITLAGGCVASFGGIAIVKKGNDTIDSAVISYNGKVKKGTLSFVPQLRDDHLALAIAFRY